MKRYVVLILVIVLVLIFRNYLKMAQLDGDITRMSGRVDSLQNVIYFYESRQVSFEKNHNKAMKITYDSINLRIKAHDSAIFSHGQQVRWLQWHVERLKSNLQP